MITEPDYTLEQLVWSLARDARDLRERVEFGVKLERQMLLDLAKAAEDLTKVLLVGSARYAEAAE